MVNGVLLAIFCLQQRLLQPFQTFFSLMTVLFGGSSVKKLTELDDLTKLICFVLRRYRLSIKSFS